MAFEHRCFAGGGIGYLGQAELLAVDFGDFGHEIEGVDGGLLGVVKEPGDVEYAALMFEDDFHAVEDQGPEAEVLSEHETGLRDF